MNECNFEPCTLIVIFECPCWKFEFVILGKIEQYFCIIALKIKIRIGLVLSGSTLVKWENIPKYYL